MSNTPRKCIVENLDLSHEKRKILYFYDWFGNKLMRNSKIIVPTRKIGNAKLFKLNLNNTFVRKLVELFDEIILRKREIIV